MKIKVIIFYSLYIYIDYFKNIKNLKIINIYILPSIIYICKNIKIKQQYEKNNVSI